MSHTYKHMLISIIPVSYLETLEILMAFMQMIKVQIIRFPRAHLAIFVRVNGEFLILLVIGLLPISIIKFLFANVLPRFGEDLNGSGNTISGDLKSIRHYIGELYTLRALEYFKRYQAFGDYPIVTDPLTDNMEILTDAAKRSPRNEVARFILSDLDKAAILMDGKDFQTTRINRDVALLLKSRVALFEATWLKYFKGSAFVPNGEGWPGKTKEYNANYQYPSGSIDNEINWFLKRL